jgi:RNase P subunit RPR2
MAAAQIRWFRNWRPHLCAGCIGGSAAITGTASAAPQSTDHSRQNLVTDCRTSGPIRRYVWKKVKRLAGQGLADRVCRKNIDIQYFIWSSDNVGILASEACSAPPTAA